MEEKKVKQVIVVRKDLNMRKGKIAAQVAHASLAVVLNEMSIIPPSKTVWGLCLFEEDPLTLWIKGLFTKVVVSCDSEEQLLEIQQHARNKGIRNALITDAGLTEFNNVPTNTCCAIGPGFEEDIDQITGHLKLM